MRKYIVSGLLLLVVHFASAQTTLVIDSLKQQLSVAKEDTNKVQLLTWLSSQYTWSYPDTCIQYTQEALALAKQLNYDYGIAISYYSMCRALTTSGNFPLALEYGFKALNLFERLNKR